MRVLFVSFCIILTASAFSQRDSSRTCDHAFSLGVGVSPPSTFSKDNSVDASSLGAGAYLSYRILNKNGLSVAIGASEKSVTVNYYSHDLIGETHVARQITYGYYFINPALFLPYSKDRKFTTGIGFYLGLLMFSNSVPNMNAGTAGVSFQMDYKVFDAKKGKLKLGLLTQGGSKDLKSPWSFTLLLSYVL